MALAAFQRRLPGFRFEVQAPRLDEVLPRMDIAVFVGFAASGPIHRPVPVEDAAAFEEIFGADCPLAWDARRAERRYGYLAPAVRAFFSNGGVRCWVIRVAGPAEANQFPIYGLAGVSEKGEFSPAFAAARSQGSWSDGIETCATLLSDPVHLVSFDPGRLEFTLGPNAIGKLSKGDLLRATFDELGCGVIFPLRASPGDARTLTLPLAPYAVWYRVMKPGDRIPAAWPALGGEVTEGGVTLMVAADEAPKPGELVGIELGGEQLWITVQDARPATALLSPPVPVFEVKGQGLWRLRMPPDVAVSPPLAVPPALERLSFELWARQGETALHVVSNLGFAPGHERYWDELPTDLELYPPLDETRTPREPKKSWDQVRHPRFPLSGGRARNEFYIPIGMPLAPDRFLAASATSRPALARSGLDQFRPELFLDTDLLEPRTTDLLSEADYLRYQAVETRELRGIHGALSIEEATIIAVPDATHRPWKAAAARQPEPPAPSQPAPHPEWWTFLPCDQREKPPTRSEPEWENFLDCNLKIVVPPRLHLVAKDAWGDVTISWTAPEDGVFVVEESPSPNPERGTEIYRGTDRQVTLYGRAAGVYYYRARLLVGTASSNWSASLTVCVDPPGGFEAEEPDRYSPQTLLNVHRSLLRLCAARGDLFAVLSCPEHYDENAVLQHIGQLKLRYEAASEDERGGRVPLLQFNEQVNFSYAALYHPWVVGREGSGRVDFRYAPPDGVACGVLAQRALARGAWIAPANQALRGVVALSPEVRRDRWQDLQDVQVNVVRHEPRGFLVLNADTLSDDPDLRPLNVRRLLSLLRRLALREGARYVFEPHDDPFRRLVQRSFESMLEYMYQLGAFAGSTSRQAYQVVTGESLNTPQSVEQGRFIVELRVAPSIPMRFLTVRLLQTGDRAVVVEAK